jgi:hypothetical protein
MTGYFYSCRVRDDKIDINRKGGSEWLEVSFRRTVRVPDNASSSSLPPNLGKLPLYKVRDYEASLPLGINSKGGVFLPMYREFILSFDDAWS